MPDPVVIATWPFGMIAVKKSIAWLADGKPALDAAIAGAQDVEDDPTVHSVGFAGIANAVGTVSLDACVMDGKSLSCGAVAGVENIRHVAALARLVMEKTPHILLVGAGAKEFAIQQQFPLETLSTPESIALWEKGRPRRRGGPPSLPPEQNHDTVTVLALDKNGNLSGVCTTSGLPYKLPGRVGDSPLIGHALYVDNEAGAAGATGTGEEIIRIGGSLRIVESMRGGKSPQEACEQAIRKINAVAMRRGMHPENVSFLAMSPKGEVGAACTTRARFEYAIAKPGQAAVLITARVIPAEDR